MNWDTILNVVLNSGITTYFSLDSLPVARRGFGTSKDVSGMGVPIGETVYCDFVPSEDWLAALEKMNLRPGTIETKNPLEEGLEKKKVAVCTPSEGHFENVFYSMPKKEPEYYFQRKFLLEKLGTEIPVPLFLNPEDWIGKGYNEICAALGVSSSEGFLARQNLSAMGESIRWIMSAAEFMKSPPHTTSILVGRVEDTRVLKNIEVTMSLADGCVEVLGICEQVTFDHKKIGIQSLPDDPDLGNVRREIIEIANKIGAVCVENGLERGIFGFDLFLLKKSNRKGRVLVYDFNPCASQAFFPQLLTKKIQNILKTEFKFGVRLYSVFTRGTGENSRINFSWSLGLEGGFVPMILFQRPLNGLNTIRWTVMVLCLAPKTDIVLYEREFQKWCALLQNANSSLIQKIQSMPF